MTQRKALRHTRSPDTPPHLLLHHCLVFSAFSLKNKYTDVIKNDTHPLRDAIITLYKK